MKPLTQISPTVRSLAGWCLLSMIAGVAEAQLVTSEDPGAAPGAPRVVVPASGQRQPGSGPLRILYPWKTFVTCSIFWIGEQPTENNPVPNCKSSWDTNWMTNFGGYDNPDPTQRIADFASGDFRPKAFVPKLNPFYVALPYNDLATGGTEYKLEAKRVIPWFHRVRVDGRLQSVCKGRWIQIMRGNRSCYAQWEDCGPWETDDWPFVFGDKPPKNTQNRSAGIDISPAVRDYLGVKSFDKVHWRFVEESQVPYGPWKKYGQDSGGKKAAELDAQRQYLDYLRRLRDEQFLKKSVREMQY